MADVTLRKWVEDYKKGNFTPSKEDNFTKMCEAGWNDWFCSDNELFGRLKKCYNIASKITNEYILDNFYVWFKNNCPVDGPLYDDMRFEPIDETMRDKKYFLIAFNCCHYNDKYAVITARNGYELEYQTNSEEELLKFINSLDFMNDKYPSINDWIKKLGPVENLTPRKLMDTTDIVNKHLQKRIFEKYPSIEDKVYSKLINRCIEIYRIMLAVDNDNLKKNYFVELTEFNHTGNSFFFDRCSFKSCDDRRIDFML